MKRVTSFLLAVLMSWLSVISPAQAFAPAAVLGVPVFVGVSNSTYLLGGLAGLVGLTGLYLELKDLEDNAIRIPMKVDATIPAPPTPANVAPDSGSGVCFYNSVTLQEECTSSAMGTCALYASAASSGNTTYTATGVTWPKCDLWKVTICDPGFCMPTGRIEQPAQSGTILYNKAMTTCPEGFTLSGDTCVFSGNPREVIDDKTCDILLSSGQFATASDMNCPATADGQTLTPLIRDGKVLAYGKNSNGEPLLFSVQYVPSQDLIQVNQYTQTQYGQQSVVEAITYAIAASTGEIVQVSSAAAPGSIAAPTGQTVPTTDNNNPATEPQVQTNTDTPLQFQFPDDYARRGEAQTASNSLRDSILAESPAPPDPVIPPSSEFNDVFFNGTFDGLTGWTVPGHVSECPFGSFDFFGNTYFIDGHCALINQHFGTLNAAMGVVWLLVALFIVLRA